jgi:hypothetical protein
VAAGALALVCALALLAASGSASSPVARAAPPSVGQAAPAARGEPGSRLAAALDPRTDDPDPGPVLELPAPGARTTLPLHFLARLGQPGDPVAVVLRWDDGTEVVRAETALRGEDGRGLVIGSLDWPPGRPAAPPPTQPATLELRDSSGVRLRRPVTVLGADDPGAQEVMLYWVRGERFEPTPRRIPRTRRVATAALEELLWGPPAGTGLLTALPTPADVLAYAGRGPGWGPRVRLRGVAIRDGVATADFSEELAAYGGGSTRVSQIAGQITRTLRQFPTVRAVRIAVDGETEAVLEP